MPIDWNSLIQNPDFIMFPMFALMGFVALGVIGLIQWRRVQQTKYNAYLKERLIERGFTAEEIVNVVKAGEPCVRRREFVRGKAVGGAAVC